MEVLSLVMWEPGRVLASVATCGSASEGHPCDLPLERELENLLRAQTESPMSFLELYESDMWQFDL